MMEKYSTSMPSPFGPRGMFEGWTEVGDCMKCGRHAILIESRDGDGAHACKFGCDGPTGLEDDEKGGK